MTIAEFSEVIGLHPDTIRKYIKQGIIKPLKTPGGQYRFTEEHVKQLLGLLTRQTNQADTDESKSVITNGQTRKKVVIYARVSSPDKSRINDLDRQIQVCKMFAAKHGLTINEVISDRASAFNFERPGLKKLLDMLFNRSISHLIVYSPDRLTRVGFNCFKVLCDLAECQILVVDQSEKLEQWNKDEFIQELVSFMHYWTSRLYGQRKYKKVLQDVFCGDNNRLQKK